MFGPREKLYRQPLVPYVDCSEVHYIFNIASLGLDVVQLCMVAATTVFKSSFVTKDSNSWQKLAPFGPGQNSHKSFHQTRIYYFRNKLSGGLHFWVLLCCGKVVMEVVEVKRKCKMVGLGIEGEVHLVILWKEIVF